MSLQTCIRLSIFVLSLLMPWLAHAASSTPILHATSSLSGFLCLSIFILAYILVMMEEVIELKKSKPVVFTAGIIWVIVAIVGNQHGLPHIAEEAARHYILEYAELFLFLLVAMTYINAMEERNVFETLRAWLINQGYNYRKLFCITGILGFFISPIADNLTTALLMGAVIMAVGNDNPRFVGVSFINLVVAVNAGGAFSPFGDITTLMVWQKGVLPFQDFFKLFLPSVLNYLIPSAILYFAVPNVKPKITSKKLPLKVGAKNVIILFLLTITTAVLFFHYLHLPPTLGMMTGLGYLFIYAFYIRKSEHTQLKKIHIHEEYQLFDIFNKVRRAEWDTLLFFYGVILCVGGLATLGYLELLSNFLYIQLGENLSVSHQATPANILIGILSAIVDNIPIMFAILTMSPSMSEGQWLLVTLTTGVGGSLLSIGSAAGVALMGQSRGLYTFISHLKWSWAILLGYFVSILSHFWINASLF